MKKLIAGNWKMHGTKTSAVSLIEEISAGIQNNTSLLQRCDFLVCPPSLHIDVVNETMERIKTPARLGGQDCAATENGAYTGNISAAMLKDIGCRYVILGHSERRIYQQETSAFISEKAGRAHIHGLTPVICIGEKEDEREKGHAFDVIKTQLLESLPDGARADNIVIAYEPVWAIGTGKSAAPDDIQAMHGFIREQLKERLEKAAQIRILYGGSVKPENAGVLFQVQNVDGALIGGASLTASQFLGIAQAA